jgi:hypothetical protein
MANPKKYFWRDRILTMRILIGFLLLSLNAFIFENLKAQTLNWEERKLRLDDFKATELSIDTLAAQASVFIGMAQKSNGEDLVFSIKACFEQSESWIKLAHQNQETLNHEQGHFDITEIYARVIIKRLSSKKFSINDVSEAENIYREVVQEMNDLQILYDLETKGGTIIKKQREWLLKIQGLISP